MPAYKIRLIKKETIAHGTMAFHFEKPHGFVYRAGQYGDFTLINPPELSSRGIQAAIDTVQFYANELPGVKFHGFGISIKALDDPVVFATTKSWDTYSWSWGRGKRNMPEEYRKRENETHSAYARRLASLYWDRTVCPRLMRSRQMTLHELFNIQEISPLQLTGD